MFLKITGLFGLFFLFIACDSQVSGDNTGASNKETDKTDTLKTKVENISEAHTCDTTRVDAATYSVRGDDFILSAVEKELTRKYLDSMFIGIERKDGLAKNQHQSNEIDTTATYKSDCDTVAYLATKGNSFPLYVSIQSGRMAFDNGSIKVGVSKDQVMEKFHIKKGAPDVIKITEMEGANEFILVFAKDKLVHIIYHNSYVD